MAKRKTNAISNNIGGLNPAKRPQNSLATENSVTDIANNVGCVLRYLAAVQPIEGVLLSTEEIYGQQRVLGLCADALEYVVNSRC